MIPKITEEAFISYKGSEHQRGFVYQVLLQAKNIAYTM